MRRQILMLLSVLFLTASSEKRIDSTTEESLKRSLESVSSSLDGEEREHFLQVIEYLVGTTAQPADQALKLPAAYGTRPLYRVLDGKTAKEVMAVSLRIGAERQARLERRIAQLYGQLDSEQVARVGRRSASPVADRFRVLASRFFFITEGDSLMYQPIIELTVENDTGRWVHKAYLWGTLTPPGFEVAWVNDEISFAIPEGLEPGGTASLQLAPNLFGAGGQCHTTATT